MPQSISPCAGDVESAVDHLLNLKRRLVFTDQIAVVAQIMDDRVAHDAVFGERLAHGRNLEYADAQGVQPRVVERFERAVILVGAIGEDERRAIQRRRENFRAFGIGRHVHPHIAIAFRQRRAHQSALDRRPPIILNARADRFAERLRDFIFEAFAFLVRQRHVARIGADRDRFDRIVGNGMAEIEKADGEQRKRQRLHGKFLTVLRGCFGDRAADTTLPARYET